MWLLLLAGWRLRSDDDDDKDADAAGDTRVDAAIVAVGAVIPWSFCFCMEAVAVLGPSSFEAL